MMYFGQGVNQMSILPSFSVIPSKTFLGLDRSKGYCFTVRKAVTPQIIEFFELTPDKLQQNIVFVTEEGEFPALLRLIVQNKSKPNKQGIKRNWKDRLVLNISWKNKKDTTSMFTKNLTVAYELVSKGLKNNRQISNFEHLGGNRFFVSFNLIYR
tara:strand:+ start:161 stop:625 length:465 start_codon:yes stop_codon:yes gene_type:complete